MGLVLPPMNLPSFSGRLRSGFDTLSPQLREAARWVIDHPADVALLSTREQARRAGVTPATMTRLAQHFGLAGYDQVRQLHADAVRRRPESYRGRAEELLVRRDREGDAGLVQDIFAALAQHLQGLMSGGATERFTAAADVVADAAHVHYVRSLFGANSVLVDGSGAVGVDVMRDIGGNDVLLAISVKPYVRHTIDAAEFAKSRGARIVAVTDSEMSPLAAAVECLAALVAARRGPEALAALEASERQLAAFGTYVLPPSKGRRRS